MAVYQNLTITQLSQDPDQNTSRVRILWQSTQTGASYNAIADVGRYTLFVNGQEQFTREVTYVLPRNTTQTIVSVEETIPHNAKGDGEVTVQTWMNTHISAGIVELSQTVKLDNIPQASIVTASDGVIGGHSRLAVTRRNSESAHAIGWSFGNLSGYLTADGQIVSQPVIFTAESVDFLLPEDFYGQIPDAKSGICTLTIYTYTGENPVGTPQEASFTVSVDAQECIPTVTGQVIDCEPMTVALTGDDRFLIRYRSAALCTITAQAKKGARIVEKRIQNVPVSESLTIQPVQSGDFIFSVTDSRGYTAQCLVHTVCLPYIQLSCLATARRDGPVSGEATLSVSGEVFGGNFGQAENRLTLAYSLDGENFHPITGEVAQNRYSAQVKLTGMDYTRLYTITLRAMDCLTAIEKQVVLKKGVPTFDWGEEDFAFHVPVGMDTPLSLESGGTGAANVQNAQENLGLRPALMPGVEYAVPALWNGRQVYTRLVELGAMPNCGSVAISHHAAAAQLLRCFGATSDGRSLPFADSRIYSDRQKVYLDTNTDESAFSAQAQIYYTKD